MADEDLVGRLQRINEELRAAQENAFEENTFVESLLSGLLDATHLGDTEDEEDDKEGDIVDDDDDESHEKMTLESVVEDIRSGQIRRIVVLAGAGISVAAGVPDFRSEEFGLYERVRREFHMEEPEEIFSISYFREDPGPFYSLVHDLIPRELMPTRTHFFFKLLEEKQLLTRVYTQNIDGLENLCGIDEDKLVEAHGSFAGAKCLVCQAPADPQRIVDAAREKKVASCPSCRDGVLRPNIVFFGEPLPSEFMRLHPTDLLAADLLLVFGTSLKVYPFASLIHRTNGRIPRILFNREKVGGEFSFEALLMGLRDPFAFDDPKNYRDIFVQGDCDNGVNELCRLLGWKEELDALQAREEARIRREFQKKTESSSKEKE